MGFENSDLPANFPPSTAPALPRDLSDTLDYAAANGGEEINALRDRKLLRVETRTALRGDESERGIPPTHSVSDRSLRLFDRHCYRRWPNSRALTRRCGSRSTCSAVRSRARYPIALLAHRIRPPPITGSRPLSLVASKAGRFIRHIALCSPVKFAAPLGRLHRPGVGGEARSARLSKYQWEHRRRPPYGLQ